MAFEGRAIDVEGIFPSDDEAALKWRKALKLKLLNVCLRALTARILLPKNPHASLATTKQVSLKAMKQIDAKNLR